MIRRRILTVLFIAMVSVVGIATIRISDSYLSNSHRKGTLKCGDEFVTHSAVIAQNTLSPTVIDAKRCDLLVIRNNDTKQRRIAFGTHDHHTSYSGLDEKIIQENESFEIKLTESGEFVFHDHFDDKISGTVYISR